MSGRDAVGRPLGSGKIDNFAKGCKRDALFVMTAPGSLQLSEQACIFEALYFAIRCGTRSKAHELGKIRLRIETVCARTTLSGDVLAGSNPEPMHTWEETSQ